MRKEMWMRTAALLLALLLALQMTGCRGRRDSARADRNEPTEVQPVARRRQRDLPTNDLDNGEKITRRRRKAEEDANKDKRRDRKHGSGNSSDRRRRRGDGSTAEPTLMPTFTPDPIYTEVPIVQPTDQPDDNQETPAPTGAPGDIPTQEPTALPTQAPTQVPSPTPAPLDRQEMLFQETVRGLEQAEYPVSLNCTYDEFLEVYDRLRDTPAVFWIRGYQASYSSDTVDVYFIYTHETPEEIQKGKAMIAETEKKALEGIPAGATDYEKALYIHDWLVQNITYVSDGGWHDQTIYGALGLHECVCAGISEAFTYLCRKAGLDVYTIIGFGGYVQLDPSKEYESNHAWNGITLEGSTYYVDVTWDNMDEADGMGREYVEHVWFMVWDDEMIKTHLPAEEEDFKPTTSKKYNYYVMEGSYFERADLEGVKQAYSQQMEEGENYLEVKFGSEAVMDQILKNIGALCTHVNVNSYYENKEQLTVCFRVA